ncbi:MAG: OB-fold nucleic acid binding domain-containing protein [Thermoleophilaceae bacterium]
MDCGLGDLEARKDGDWVTVGGMIAEAKKIRTRNGDDMMFATLDDLEAQVEMIVFKKAFEANAGQIEADRVVIVRGRVDHKEAGRPS